MSPRKSGFTRTAANVIGIRDEVLDQADGWPREAVSQRASQAREYLNDREARLTESLDLSRDPTQDMRTYVRNEIWVQIGSFMDHTGQEVFTRASYVEAHHMTRTLFGLARHPAGRPRY